MGALDIVLVDAMFFQGTLEVMKNADSSTWLELSFSSPLDVCNLEAVEA